MGERLSKSLQKTFGRRPFLHGVALMPVILATVTSDFPDKITPHRPEEIGGTYSYRRALDFGLLDWKQGFKDFLTKNPSEVRFSCYWDDMEPSPGKYDFHYLDEYYDILTGTNIPAIQVQGMKGLGALSRTTRKWQEFFLPSWLENEAKKVWPGLPLDSNKTIANAALDFIQAAAEYANQLPNIKTKQAENEAASPMAIGGWEYLSPGYINAAANRVRPTLDQTGGEELLLTNSSSVFPAINPVEFLNLRYYAQIADRVGQHIYIVVPNEVGDSRVAPELYYLKLKWQNQYLVKKGVEPSADEIQIEPWFYNGKPISGSENPQIFLRMVYTLGGCGFNRGNLWGIEHAQAQEKFNHDPSWSRVIDQVLKNDPTIFPAGSFRPSWVLP